MYLSFYFVLQFIFWIRIIQTYVLPLDLGSLALNYLNQPFQHTRNMYETDTYEFYFNSGNKIARIEIGQNEELSLTDVLRAVQDILVAGGFTYVDEVRAVNYGERENKIKYFPQILKILCGKKKMKFQFQRMMDLEK